MELGLVEGDVAHARPGDARDVSAQHLVRFPSLNPYTYTQRALEVVNKA